MPFRVPEPLTHTAVLAQAIAATPEAFDGTMPRNLINGEWRAVGEPAKQTTPVDGTIITSLRKIDAATATEAVRASARAHQDWTQTPFARRQDAVASAVDALSDVRDVLALLLAWEIGKPWKLACADVDRCLDGARWYAENIEPMLSSGVDGAPYKRQPLPGPVSNIASWNYPMSVLVHAELVQMLSGNAAIAKTPSQGGALTLTLAHAVLARAGLPATLLSGSGSALSDALVRSPEIGALAFVGGRSNGGKIAAQLVDTGKRHMLEQEGLNAWGIWEFSDWDGLATHLRKGFEYAKQRCTAYPRFVVQRKLVDRFLAAYLPMVRSVRFGHPLAIEDGGELPQLDFGPLISPAKAAELDDSVAEALRHGAVPLYRGDLDQGHFVPGQDTSSYAAPVTLLAPPGAARLMHEEPFGPVDTIVVVDTEAELLAQMNASNGALVASIACDDTELAAQLAEHVQAFKVGINKPRSRGDRAEPFGGRGASWKGAFVGGEHLVHAVTTGPPGEQLYGNFPGYHRSPQT